MQTLWILLLSMLTGTVVLAGGSMGIYRALNRIYGLSAGTWFLRPAHLLAFHINNRKRIHTASFHFGRIPAALLAAGVWGFCGGIMSVFGSKPTKEALLITGISSGLGMIYAWIVRTFFDNHARYSRFQFILAAGILSSLMFWIGGWRVHGLNTGVLMMPLGWLIGIITTILLAGDAFEDLDKTVSRGILIGIFVASLLGSSAWSGIQVLVAFTEGGSGIGELLDQAGEGLVMLALWLTVALIFFHAPLNLLARIWLLLTFFIVNILDIFCDRLLTPFLIRARFRTIICNQCLRYTHPLRAAYDGGMRQCEHCRQDVEFTHECGAVVVVFGTLAIEREGRVFLLRNPDFEQNTRTLDITEIQIDTAGANPRLIERFLTYIVNYPPENGLKSVRVFHRGPLRDLGDNLENALQNNLTVESAEQ